MRKKKKSFSAEFKKKVILKMFEENLTINEVASKFELHPNTVKQWKNQFLENATLAFDKSSVVKEYKEEIAKLQKEKEQLAKKLGETIIEKEWLEGKLKSLDLSKRVELVKNSPKVQAKDGLSLNKQLKLLNISKTAFYYTKKDYFKTKEGLSVLNEIDKIYTDFPYYGTRRMKEALKDKGIDIGRKLIKRAYEALNIEALYPKKRTTHINNLNYKYPYLLNEFKNEANQVVINKPNKVWSGDITYIRLKNGYAYLAVIIDWHTRKILSWKLSNTIDVRLTTSVLKEALSKYPKPQIFNSDQGSQYTAKEHIEILKQNDISISMDAKGRSIDNIIVERFFRSLKYEEVYLKSYINLKEASNEIGKYINTYNSKRFHSSIGYKTPDEVYFSKVKIYQNNLEKVA
jgi:putative transposase